jgi:hypothetical protein
VAKQRQLKRSGQLADRCTRTRRPTPNVTIPKGTFEERDRETAIEAIFTQPQGFPPAVEQVTGDEYQDVVRQRVSERVHMDGSGF